MSAARPLHEVGPVGPVAAGPAEPRGLTSAAATERMRQLGPNALTRQKVTPWWRTLLAQFTSPLILLLLGACALSAFLGALVDASAIGAIVVLNGLVGFFQEYRAEKAVLALRSMTAPQARVLRDGHPKLLPSTQVVVDDVLVLEAGDIIPADAELLEAHALRTSEAALTGESAPVDKRVGLTPGAHLAERTGELFLGAAVVNGTALAQVRATGMQTELGKIAHLLATVEDDDTPLEKQIARISRILLGVCLGVVAVVAGLGLMRGEPLMAVFLSAVSLAVAAVPEGLPAIITIALSVGVQRMARRNVLVRHLPAVETLGCASVVCTDKTGTLTTGVMKVRALWGPDEARTLQVAAGCCDADLKTSVGDPTELALLSAAAERGIHQEDLERDHPRVAVQPFDPIRKRMSIFRADQRLYLKGAYELVAPLCRQAPPGAAQANGALAAKGLRVLAVALGSFRAEAELELVGLVGLADPPRPEAIAAIAAARSAGIQVVMVTGDHPVTAAAIATELGLLLEGDSVEGRVHARTTPAEKLQIVKGWKKRGAIVAMTGDGVNDAPALREAHIGIAMGKTGTAVTREAADLVLTDDNFASIIAAVREGRGIFDNIRKAVVYRLPGNFGELLLMLVAAIGGLPLPLLPLQLLWINLVTDGLPALALVVDPADPEVMSRPPRKGDAPMLGWKQWRNVAFTAVIEVAVTLGVFAWALKSRDLSHARNLAFSTFVFAEMFRAFAARSETRVFWETGVFSNLLLLGVIGVSIGLQLLIQVVPFTQRLFSIHSLTLTELGLALGLALVPATVLELKKLLGRPSQRQS